MVDFSKYNTEEIKIEVPKVITPKLKQKTIKKAVKSKKNDNDNDLIRIESDDFRTAFRLITKNSNRDNLLLTRKKLLDFFDTYTLVQKGKKYYFQKKN